MIHKAKLLNQNVEKLYKCYFKPLRKYFYKIYTLSDPIDNTKS